MIGIINYGLGNIKAFANVYKNLGIPNTIITKPEDFNEITKIILPGVGAFDHAINLLNRSGMRENLETAVLEKKIPVLGICVGMQIIAKSSEEGKLPGLGWIDSEVKLFDKDTIHYKTTLPHMGWNTITPKNNRLLNGLSEGSRFYFLHSYYFQCSDISNEISNTKYGINFTSAINKENIYGVQFHPEKSHSNGIQVLKNFGTL